MDKLTPEQRRRNMQAVKSKNSQLEISLGRALWSRGYRYRKNDKQIFGKPDFTFKKYRIAIFCDSEFWHGKDWKSENQIIKPIKIFGCLKSKGISNETRKSMPN